MSRQGLDALRARVSDDPELARHLSRIEPARFTAEVLASAAALGCDVGEDDLRDAVIQARTAWMMRWLG